MPSTVTVLTNAEGELCGVHKQGKTAWVKEVASRTLTLHPFTSSTVFFATLVYLLTCCISLPLVGEAVGSKHLIRCVKESTRRCNDIHEVLKSIAEPSAELAMES